MHILHAITREPGVLIRFACSRHGTRVLQKVIGTLQTTEQLSMFVTSLKQHGIVSLMDINDNHVAEHCLMFFFHLNLRRYVLFVTLCSLLWAVYFTIYSNIFIYLNILLHCYALFTLTIDYLWLQSMLLATRYLFSLICYKLMLLAEHLFSTGKVL